MTHQLPGAREAWFDATDRGESTVGIIDKLRGEFIDIIEWTEPSQNDVLAYRFPRYNNEIKMGAQLVVREGQAAVFVNEGKLADVFQPGTYTLSTENLPILATLYGWKYGFNSPFKAEVYFIAMRQWTDQKWGTQNPIMVRDPEFGPVRIRAFGTYAMHVSDPAVFLRQLVATDPSFEAYEISNQLRNTIVSRFADVLGTAKTPVLDMAGNYDKLSQLALEKIKPDLASLGLALTLFYVENISLPEEVEQALDTRTKMGVLGDMNQYTRYQTATAIGDAARNPSGVAGAGVGLGAGVAIGNQMAGNLGTAMASATAPGAAAPPSLAPTAFYVAVDGAQSGPYDRAALGTLVEQGKLNRDTLVWHSGLAQWATASSVPEVASVFAASPPPLPPR
ncbi:MAG TPA: SPFH domain-containing protein [Pirellulales bacterium]|nr:SPFH domain-containing protein [Pirellulales bacterium]